MKENSDRCIFRTNTRPVFMEVHLQSNGSGEKEYAFQIYGLNRKGTSVPNVVEFLIPGAAIWQILDIAREAKNESLFCTFKSNEYVRRMSYNDRIEEKLGKERTPREEMLSDESIERAFFTSMFDNRSRGAYLNELRYQDPEDEENSLSASVFTIDYHPVRNNGEPAQKPWVFSIRQRKKKTPQSSMGDCTKAGHVWVAEKPVEINISEDQFQELAEAIEGNHNPG